MSFFDFGDLGALLEAHENEQKAVRAAKRARASVPRRLGTYDTETDGFHNCEDVTCTKCHGLGRIPAPFLHGIYYGDNDEYLEFETIEQVVEYVQKQRALFYAHNGGKYDYHPLRGYMNTDEPIMLINGRIARFRIGEAEFRDSLNIFPNTRLSDFGVKTEIDYAKMEPGVRDIPEVRREISLYMKQDCVGLWEQVNRFRRDYGKNLTQAGATMKYWEKHHHGDKAPRQTKKQFEECRPFYYGGRVQCFESGVASTDFKVADINSAYPRAMLDRHPISPGASESRHLPRTDEAIQTCLIQLRCTARGCFPWRDDKGELYFPDDQAAPGRTVGMRRYYITGWEFLAALEQDAVANIQIENVLTFAQTTSFKEYIETAYAERMHAAAVGDKAGKIFGKYRMNGLYGKFGADPSNYAEYVIATTDSVAEWKAKGYVEYQTWGEGKWLMEREPTERELSDINSRWRYYNVATAASITGWVRAYLFKSLSCCGGVIYCDTDSIAARSMSHLDYGAGLGLWKHEGDFDRYCVAGKKLYAFHKAGAAEEYDPEADEKNRTWKVASKGVAFHTMKDGPQKIALLARGGEVEYRPQVPTYSVSREVPIFISRSVRRTAKDIRVAPFN